MFKLSAEYKEIVNEIVINNIINNKAKFECFSDSVFTYGCKKDNLYHQFCFIADETLLNNMVISELLEMNSITFFEHTIYHVNKDLSHEYLGSKSWSSYDYSGLN